MPAHSAHSRECSAMALESFMSLFAALVWPLAWASLASFSKRVASTLKQCASVTFICARAGFMTLLEGLLGLFVMCSVLGNQVAQHQTTDL